ncbi:SDR family oxidoreductase [Flammeovirgaceae bacterium SG7u.111]|nr:SDR family oxidoreductase [Flammeovirgaceae bacterium SG7u.132]WPO36679.1 SDR family oxidoreductase [Flammeovirgaceae bacterium SG7u.111]
MILNLKGKTAIVCGSTQGIGKASAIELAKLGARVILCARNEASLQKTMNELDTAEEQVHGYIVADFSEPAEVKSVIDNWVSENGGAHILVNNTGGPAAGSVLEADPKAFLEAFSAHLICNQYLVQALVPYMKQEKYGRIINIISTSVKAPIVGLGVSNTTRGAVASWAKTLATELAADGITVNNVLPGLTMTGRLQSIIDTRAEAQGITSEKMAEQMKAGVPARRFAEPKEVANSVAFLATPEAAFINGINLPVDGGSTPSL